MRAVIADDSSTQRDQMKSVLRQLGHEVVAACPDGAQAWNAIATLNPDFVVLDYIMPIMTGAEVAARLRMNASPIKVIMASSMGQKNGVYAVECDAVVIKPPTAPLVAMAIAKAFA